ncbi:MAG TPA: SUF system NifU family Fe-S cluster assembly protein [Longimicrobiales bacterium]
MTNGSPPADRAGSEAGASSPALPSLSSLYQQLILEHYRNPRNRGELPGADADVRMNNPSCGDSVRLQLRFEGDRIAAARFSGDGCSISQASTSMMTQVVEGKSVAEVRQLIERLKAMMRGDEAAARDRALGDLRALAGVHRFPVRVRCALLGWNALEEALRQARG